MCALGNVTPLYKKLTQTPKKRPNRPGTVQSLTQSLLNAKRFPRQCIVELLTTLRKQQITQIVRRNRVVARRTRDRWIAEVAAVDEAQKKKNTQEKHAEVSIQAP